MEKIETSVVKPEISFTENDVVNLIISTQEESNLDSKIKEVEDFMKDNYGKGKSDEEKDNLYKDSQQLWHNFLAALKEAKYNFHLNRSQYMFLTDLLLKNLEYDVNTVFFAIELQSMLTTMKGVKFSDDKELIAFPLNATEMTYIYHLISKHKVKGLQKEAFKFAEVLVRIGGISKIFNYYETYSKNLATEIKDWIVTLDDGIDMEVRNEELQIEQ